MKASHFWNKKGSLIFTHSLISLIWRVQIGYVSISGTKQHLLWFMLSFLYSLSSNAALNENLGANSMPAILQEPPLVFKGEIYQVYV